MGVACCKSSPASPASVWCQHLKMWSVFNSEPLWVLKISCVVIFNDAIYNMYRTGLVSVHLAFVDWKDLMENLIYIVSTSEVCIFKKYILNSLIVLQKLYWYKGRSNTWCSCRTFSISDCCCEKTVTIEGIQFRHEDKKFIEFLSMSWIEPVGIF